MGSFRRKTFPLIAGLSPCWGTIPKSNVVFFAMDHARLKLHARWQCAQVPVISTTDNFGAKPVARAEALRLCATGAAGISPTEPQRSQIRNATIAAASWSCAQAR